MSLEEMDAEQECRVISGHFALFVQAFLASMVLATLLYKRYRENPKRTWTVWFMDSSKQGFGMGLQHFANVFLAVFFAKEKGLAGECIWYITNFCISVCGGLVVLTLWMQVHRKLVEKYNITVLRSGEYGEPPDVRIWAVQALYWGFVCVSEKLLIAGLVILPLHGNLDQLIAHLEKPLLHYPKTELVLVMVALPTMLNAIFAWVIDNLIKDQHGAKSEEGKLLAPANESLAENQKDKAFVSDYGCINAPASSEGSL
eukprot:gb/GFBE01022731.1/.p1 GENE.gb/GFBE01022731.1/~~gb/GFBE01022731.1/.p1  ORF type:complete len:257 (+),score=68.27 gb/GFBE01022731.1/:1-771(+)